jgi:hypothetical protein
LTVAVFVSPITGLVLSWVSIARRIGRLDDLAQSSSPKDIHRGVLDYAASSQADYMPLLGGCVVAAICAVVGMFLDRRKRLNEQSP